MPRFTAVTEEKPDLAVGLFAFGLAQYCA